MTEALDSLPSKALLIQAIFRAECSATHRRIIGLSNNSISELLDSAEKLEIEKDLINEALDGDTPHAKLIRLITKRIDKDGDGKIDDSEIAAIDAMLPDEMQCVASPMLLIFLVKWYADPRVFPSVYRNPLKRTGVGATFESEM